MSVETLRSARSRTLPFTVGALVLITLATLLAAQSAPAALRLALSLPVLIGLGGDAAVRLVLGAGRRSSTSDQAAHHAADHAADQADDRVNERLDDPLLRVALAVVLGVIMVLFAVLTLALIGVPLSPTRLALSAGGWAAALVIVATLIAPTTVPFVRGRFLPGPERGSARPVLRVLAGVVCTSVLVGGAVAVAEQLRPRTSQPSTTLEFSEATSYQADPARAEPGSTVKLGIRLLGYDSTLPSATPSLDVTLGADRPARLRVSWLAVSSLGAPAQTSDADPAGAQTARSAAVQFRAPSQPGLYRLALQTTSPQDGSDLLLTTYLEVRS